MTEKETPKFRPSSPGPTRRKDPTPIRFQKLKDKYGTTYKITPSTYSRGINELEIWVDRKPEEKFWLRQENQGHVDLIQLDLGQAYDVIRALSEALDTND